MIFKDLIKYSHLQCVILIRERISTNKSLSGDLKYATHSNFPTKCIHYTEISEFAITLGHIGPNWEKSETF